MRTSEIHKKLDLIVEKMGNKEPLSAEDEAFVQGVDAYPLKRELKGLKRSAARKQKRVTYLNKEISTLNKLEEEITTLPYPIWLQRIPQKYSKKWDNTEPPNDLFRAYFEEEWPILTITDDLQQIIMCCDFNPDIPCSHIRMPMLKGCYFHLPNAEFYLKEDDRFYGFFMSSGSKIEVSFVFDSGISDAFSIEGEEIIGDFLEGFKEQKYVPVFKYIILLLFYCNSAQYRSEMRPEYSNLIERANQQSGPKRNKTRKRANRKFDYILITPAVSISTGQGVGTIRAAHFRRGHFRLQRYGPRNSMEKLIFIEPCFVHGFAKPKDYMVD